MGNYFSNYTGMQIDKASRTIFDPTFFSVKANSVNAMPQTGLVANTWQDVIFSGVTSELGGDFTYDGDVLTYIGDDSIELELNISCTMDVSVSGCKVFIGQWKNNTIDYGAMNYEYFQNASDEHSLPITSKFTLVKNDTLNLRIMCTSNANANIYSMQILLKQFKIN